MMSEEIRSDPQMRAHVEFGIAQTLMPSVLANIIVEQRMATPLHISTRSTEIAYATAKAMISQFLKDEKKV